MSNNGENNSEDGMNDIKEDESEINNAEKEMKEDESEINNAEKEIKKGAEEVEGDFAEVNNDGEDLGNPDKDSKEPFPIGYLIRYALNFIEEKERLEIPEEKGLSNKAIGEYIETEFKNYLIKEKKLPGIESGTHTGVDIEIYKTDIKSSRSVSPGHGAEFKSYTEIVRGISYNLILFLYNLDGRTIIFNAARFIPRQRTGDHRFTSMIGKSDKEIGAFLQPFITKTLIPDDNAIKNILILPSPDLKQGVLTLSRSKQWSVGYGKFGKYCDDINEIVYKRPMDTTQKNLYFKEEIE